MLDPSSPLLTLPVLDTALKGASDPAVRVQILSARISVLQRDLAAAPANEDDPSAAVDVDPTPLFAARLDLADGYLALLPPDHHSASSEASVVEVDCKRLLKRGGQTPWMDSIPAIRKRSVVILATIDEGLGRSSRAERWRELAEEL